MDFSVELLHTMEKDMKAMIQQVFKAVKISSPTELNHNVLMKLNKDPLANFVHSLVSLFESNLELCKSAASKVDQLKTEQLENQRELIKLKQDQTDSVENTVKTEMKSSASIVQKNSKQNTGYMTVKTIKEAVKSVVAEDDRSKNFIIYGLEEAEVGKQEDLQDIVQKVFETTIEKNALFEKTIAYDADDDYPTIIGKHRLGEKRPDITRPIKVQLACADIARLVVRNAHRLKTCDELNKLYLAPDRTKEERTAHSKLVTEMKELIKQNSSKYYFIRNGKVNIADSDKALSSG